MRNLLLAAVALFGTSAYQAPAPPLAPPTVVLLVRHAEKAAEPAADPPLTEAGKARAQVLVAITRSAGVNAIITTQYERTRSTAAPSAAALNVTPEVVNAGPLAQHAKAVADRVKKHTGGTVLVVGHSNTIPAIVGALGATQPSDLCDSEYDALFVVVLGDTGPARVVRSKFGAPSADDAGCQSMQPR